MKYRKQIYRLSLIAVLFCLHTMLACDGKAQERSKPQDEQPASPRENAENTENTENTENAENTGDTIKSSTTEAGSAGRISPDDLVYQGAFRLPDGSEEHAWNWSGQALAFYPKGDPKGLADGVKGSLFGTGHNWNTWVSEITIPKPVISKTKTLKDLNTAKTLQKFADIRGTLFEGRYLEQPRVGLAYLPAQGKQNRDKLYFSFAAHAAQTDKSPTHGWCDLDLSKPNSTGLWNIAGLTQYLTCDYITPIPSSWAKQNTPNLRLVTGRMRDGGQVSQGPTLIAIGPWNEGNPPKSDSQVKGKILLKYSAITDETQHKMKDYHHSDDWSGVAWLTNNKRSAVVFVGTKGTGKCWYGFANGVVWPEGGPFPPVPDYPNDARGWWSARFAAQMIFYDPAQFADVAAGKIKPHEPQPYATVDISKLLFKSRDRSMHRLGAAAFDQASGLLYVIEIRGDEDKSLIHVWKLEQAKAGDSEK